MNFPALLPHRPGRLEISYKLKLTRAELDLINWLVPWIANNRYAPGLLLEICVLADLIRRKRNQFERNEAAKMKLKPAEIIALKRVLSAPPFPDEWDVDRNGLLAKIDPLTVGIT